MIATQTELSTGLGGKQDTLTAGTNIDITNNTVSVTGLASTDISDFNTAALSATASAYDSAGSAFDAQQNAEGYTDAQLTNYTTTANLETTVDGYGFAYTSEIPNSTDALSEGNTNKYYTDARVKDVLTASTQSNISITEVAGELIITAENGVADSTTDDLTEGVNNHYFTDARAQAAVAGDISTAINALDTDDIEEGTSNLYFTEARAQSAVAGDIATAIADGDILATPVYLALNIADVAKQVAATINVPTASAVTAYSWAKADFRSAELLVKVAYGSHTEISKVMLTLDTSDNIAITEYAVVGTNGSASTISADVSGTDVRVRVTTVNNNSDVTVSGTLLV